MDRSPSVKRTARRSRCGCGGSVEEEVEWKGLVEARGDGGRFSSTNIGAARRSIGTAGGGTLRRGERRHPAVNDEDRGGGERRHDRYDHAHGRARGWRTPHRLERARGLVTSIVTFQIRKACAQQRVPLVLLVRVVRHGRVTSLAAVRANAGVVPVGDRGSRSGPSKAESALFPRS